MYNRRKFTKCIMLPSAIKSDKKKNIDQEGYGWHIAHILQYIECDYRRFRVNGRPDNYRGKSRRRRHENI